MGEEYELIRRTATDKFNIILIIIIIDRQIGPLKWSTGGGLVVHKHLLRIVGMSSLVLTCLDFACNHPFPANSVAALRPIDCSNP
mmetsp:Transcript_76502/g.132316  ORF Transcript_76502/g.132316 Transcript_76502/m.132316 type:complete len:85 (+) Transcript_76502:771-1025(+)